METNSIYGPLLLEIAWEVCNKVGGIYTVIQSKTPYIIQRWKSQYCVLGPVLDDKIPFEFQPTDDFSDPYGKAVLNMRATGYEVHYGHWLIDGKPKAILINIKQAYPKMYLIKQELLQHYNLHIPDSGYESDLVHEVVAFSYLTKTFIQHLANPEVTERPVIAHFHEWMAGLPIADIKRLGLKVATVFTTHATKLGRYMAMSDKNFYKRISLTNWQEESQRRQIVPQVTMERMAAQGADVMTTVSRVTDVECEYLLGRKSDLMLPNGINHTRFAALHEFQNLHLSFKKKIHEFVMGHFFNNYTFDLDKTMYFFTSGRFEFENKGYDLTLEALYRLNQRMKKAKMDITIVTFFITRQPFTSINPKVLELRAYMEEIKETCNAIQETIGEKLFYEAATNDDPNLPELRSFVSDYWQFRYKKTVQSWKSNHLPILVTHNLIDDANDQILQYIRYRKMFNYKDDPVKIVYHPDFIDSTNPLFKLDYEQFVRGCHLGIFPSYYEPWGYTPVECIARGVPAVTSDLAGFGDYAKHNVRNLEDNGVFVIRRRNQTFDEAAEQLTDVLFDFVQQTRRERIAQRNHAEGLTEHFSWNTLGQEYFKAYRLAMERKGF
ncbi:MAG: glycosyltransferase [Chitinophagales bacterium]